MSTTEPDAKKSAERTWSILVHLSALCAFVVPFGHLLGPLVIWLIMRGDMPVVDRNGKESLNFQLTMTIIGLLCMPLLFIGIGALALVVVGILDIALVIMASVKASENVEYKYPLSWRLIG